MYDPSMRVLTVLELLQTRERITGAELAKSLEVNLRTVQRYIARLQDLGVPVESTRGPGGAYRLKPGFRLPPMMFGTEEAFALALGLDALTYLGLAEIEPATAGAKAKLERVLPVLVSERVRAMREVLLLERPRWIAYANVTLLTELATATHAQRRVRIRYQARDSDASERTVEPLGVMQHKGRWFLAAHCLLREDFRLFRIDRVKSVEQLAEHFERPNDFKLSEFVYQSIAFAPAPYQVEVWLEQTPEQLGFRVPREIVTLEPEGTGTRLRSGVNDLEEFAALLLNVGCDLEIRQPRALHDAFRAVAQRALKFAQQGKQSS